MPTFGNGIDRKFRIELFQEFDKTNKETRRAIDTVNEHINEATAHNANNISYQNKTVEGALDVLNETIKTISSDAGQSNTEIVEARVDNVGIAHDRVQDRISKIEANAYGELFNTQQSVLYSAHRGLSQVAPENTLCSFDLAGEAGFRSLECDVYNTADGALVVHHDDTVDRMTDGSGLITSKNLSEIKALNIDAGNNIDRFYPAKIPTLEEFLDVCIKYNAIPFIELKWFNDQVYYERLLKVLHDKRLINRCMLMSFGRDYLTKIRELHPTVYLGLLDSVVTQENINFAKQLRNSCLNVEKSMATQNNISLAHANGLKIGAWTVDSRQEANKLTKDGIDFITTNILSPQ